MPDDARPMMEVPARDPARDQAASLAAHAAFRALLRSRSRFVISAGVILLTFNLLQPILSVFTPLLDRPAIGAFSIGWIYAFAQFVVPLVLLHLYTFRARTYDAASAAITGRLREGR